MYHFSARNSEVVKEIVLRTHVSANRLSNRVVAITLKKEKPEKIPVTHLIAFESPRDLLRFLVGAYFSMLFILFRAASSRAMRTFRGQQWTPDYLLLTRGRIHGLLCSISSFIAI